MLTEKDYCDYDACVALKELGYPTKMTFIGEQATIEIPINSGLIQLYEAQKWLREEKKINIFVMQITIEGSGMHRYANYIQSGDKARVCRYYSLYEEALLEGIKEAVKILKDK